MSETTYCYHCATHHPNEEMQSIWAKGELRRSCKKSIEAAKQSQASRDAYGRSVTEVKKRVAGDKLR